MAHTCTASLTCLVHIVGLLVLIRVKTPNANQKVIIINLAFTEMLFCLNRVINLAWKNIMGGRNVNRVKAIMTVRLFFFTANKAVMLYLILDRFLDIFLHLKYALYFTKKKIVVILAIAWTICAIYSISLGVVDSLLYPLNYPKLHRKFNIPVSLVLDGLIVVSATITYLYFYFKVKAIHKTERGSSENQGQSSSFKFKIPFLLVTTYIMFNVVGTIVVLAGDKGRNIYLLRLSGWNLIVLGYLSDGLLYVFMQKDVRKLLYEKLCKRALRRKITSSSTDTSQN